MSISRRCSTLLLRLGLALGVIGGNLLASHPAGAESPAFIARIPDPRGTLRTDGAFAVWTIDQDQGGLTDRYRYREIYAADLRTRQVVRVATDLHPDTAPASLADGVVVWRQVTARYPLRNEGVHARDLRSGQEFLVATAKAEDKLELGFPITVGDGWVVWVEPGERIDSPAALLGRDLRTMAPPIILVSQIPWSTSLVIAGRRVAWIDGGPPPGTWRLHLLTLGGGPPTVVAEGTWFGILPSLSLGGDVVVFSSRLVSQEPPFQSEVVAIELSSGARRVLARAWLAGPPITDGRYVFWHETRTGQSPDQGDDRATSGYDLVTGSAFTSPVRVADLVVGTVVWYQPDQPDDGLYATRSADLLPSARQPAPTSPGPDLAYFPETGHTLAYGFKDFWEAHGGRPGFGYPLTEEFEQRDPDTGQRHTVQYLERQRFEYHPEHAGTPYAVALGRLGAEDAARRGLLGTGAFQPVAATAAQPPGCRYLPETQHRLCGAVRSFWEGHGLELGDAGVSFRESLALFGYPLSEEFVDPATGLVTQYFERAVVEWHPDNPVPYRVLLRRLGAERLAVMGW